jgi:hypothetical protein
MTRIGIISTAVLSLSLGLGIPAYAQQEQHEQKEENKEKPAQEKEKEKKGQLEKPRQEEKSAQQHAPEARSAQQHEHAGNSGHGRIPDDRYKANFGREHRFRVTESDYRSHRFQYGGYWFGFEHSWPSNWLYTQDVYVIEIDGVYYLCNASYPGVNLVLSVTL